MKYFYFSFFLAFAGIVGAFFIGGWSGAYICTLLAILEISLSFDNAVVNAKTLSQMTPIWQERFFVFGLPIAVFGMRLVFPIIIVAIAANLGIFETLNLAINDPDLYHEHLSKNKVQIYMFGGAFLLMVALNFFFDEREIVWIKPIEANPFLNTIKKIPAVNVFVASSVGILIIYFSGEQSHAIAYFSAIFLYLGLKIFDKYFGSNGVKNGLSGFLYLEVLDASFSFDGVIGAFAMSENIFIIMLGLGIGAMFVRSFTIFMVRCQTLKAFKYLEHGANYAILALAIIMFVDIFYEVGEIITGTVSLAFILAAFVCSLVAKKYENKQI